MLYAPPTFRQGEERRGDGSIVQPASRWKALKVNIRLGTMEKQRASGTGANIGAEREDASPTGMEDTH